MQNINIKNYKNKDFKNIFYYLSKFHTNGGLSMKNTTNLYYNGFIGILATSSSLLASIERQQNFHLTFPYIFYTAQLILCSMFIYSVFYTLGNCNKTLSYTKDRLMRSVIIYAIIYLTAYTNFEFSNIFIFTVGITETYIVVKSNTNLLNTF